MIRIRAFLWILVALAAGLFALFAYQLRQPKDEFVESAMIGKPIPPFALPAAAADRPGLASADLADGKPKLLNVFASWCVPCIAEAPQLAELERAGAVIVGVAIRDRPEDLAAFLARNGNPFSRIGKDDISAVQLSIGSSGVPETFVIDGKGVIRYQHIGDIRENQIPMLLEELRKAGS
jgi:cytochrome c biogenesis protein CcmG/thiol:disulfide interchange protein DsbE